jgi:hypothetical protein
MSIIAKNERTNKREKKKIIKKEPRQLMEDGRDFKCCLHILVSNKLNKKNKKNMKRRMLFDDSHERKRRARQPTVGRRFLKHIEQEEEEKKTKNKRTVFDGSNSSSLSSNEMKLLFFVLAELSGCKCRYWPIVMQILSLIAPQYAQCALLHNIRCCFFVFFFSLVEK